jgi:hypothetical protein
MRRLDAPQSRLPLQSQKAPMQQFACVKANETKRSTCRCMVFTAVDLGYQRGRCRLEHRQQARRPATHHTFILAFRSDLERSRKAGRRDRAPLRAHRSVYQENSPERIYFLMLYNIFNEFLEDLDEDVLPNDLTGYQDSLIWNKLFNFQRDAATGIINKLETYNGCILADSVGLGKTFTALAVIKYYELRNRSVLVLCPKKLADNWRNYNRNLTTNIFAKDRFNYDVLCHTDLQRTSGESFGTPLNRVNWGNYDLVVIDESHNFRNNDVFKDRETRYQKLMNKVIRAGVKTKVLMLSATPVNNRFTDLRNQLALAYEGQSEKRSARSCEDTGQHRGDFPPGPEGLQRLVNAAAGERTAAAILKRSISTSSSCSTASPSPGRASTSRPSTTRRTSGSFPERRKPLSFHCPLTERNDVMGFNEIFTQLSVLKLAVYAPISYILPSRLRKYEETLRHRGRGRRGKLRQADRERSLQALMTTNLLKRLESSVEAFRSRFGQARRQHLAHARCDRRLRENRAAASVSDYLAV